MRAPKSSIAKVPFVLVGVAAALGATALVACASLTSAEAPTGDAVPRPVKQAPTDIRALVEAAATTTGPLSRPEDAPVVAAFAARGFIGTVDAPLSELTHVLLEFGQQGLIPSATLASEMAERLGVGVLPAATVAVKDEASLDAEIEKALATIGNPQRGLLGIARPAGARAVLVTIAATPLQLAPLDRRRAAGEAVAIAGVLAVDALAGLDGLKAYADAPDGTVSVADVDIANDGAFQVQQTMPGAGLARLELFGVEHSGVERHLQSLTLYVGPPPALSAAADDGRAPTAASTAELINTLRVEAGVPPVEVNPVLVPRGDGAAEAEALTHDLAQADAIVRHAATATFDGMSTLDELGRTIRTSPWARSVLLKKDMTQLGVAAQPAVDGSVRVSVLGASVSDHIDRAAEAERALRAVNRARKRQGSAVLAEDTVVAARLQTFVERICTGEVDAHDSSALQIALDPALRKQHFRTIATYSYSGDEIPGGAWTRAFPDVLKPEHNTAAVGACSGPHADPREKNSMFVVLVVGDK